MRETNTNISVDTDILLNVHSRSVIDHPALQEDFIPLSVDARADLIADISPKHKLLAETKILQRQLEEKRRNLVRAQNEFHAAENVLAKHYHIQEMYSHIEAMEGFYHEFRGKLSELCGHFDPDHPEVDQMLHWFHGIENALHALGVSNLPETHIHPEWSLDNIRKIVEHDTFDILEAHQEHVGKFAGISAALDRLITELAGKGELSTLYERALQIRKHLDSQKRQTSTTESGEKNESLSVELSIQAGGVHPAHQMKTLLIQHKEKKDGIAGHKSPHEHIYTNPEYN